MDDPETHELIAHFAGLVAQRAWGTVVLEQVPAFFDSTAWEMVLGRATAAGYLLVGVVKVDVRDCGLYQSRSRCIAVLTLQGPPKYDFESCVRALAALEAADTLRLADYFVAPHQYAEYGVSQDDAREHRLLTVEEASKLEHALAIRRVDGKPAPLTVRQAARHWCFVDLDRSESWVHALEGCVPTLTRAHASRSIYCTHGSVSRFLFPIEHLLFMGAQRPQVKVAPHDAPAHSLPRQCATAGGGQDLCVATRVQTAHRRARRQRRAHGADARRPPRARALLPGRVSRVGATAGRCRGCEPGRLVVTVGSGSRPVAIGLIVEPSSPRCQNDTIF
jgi:site-specific DNA-cytosine methylase